MIRDIPIGVALHTREAAEDLHDGCTEIRRALDRAIAQRDRLRVDVYSPGPSVELLTLIGDLSVLLDRAEAVSARATEIAEQVSTDAVRRSEIVSERGASR